MLRSQNMVKIFVTLWQAAEIIGGLLAKELQSHRVTDTQGYSVYGWVKFFVPDFNKLPYSLCSQGDNSMVFE